MKQHTESRKLKLLHRGIFGRNYKKNKSEKEMNIQKKGLDLCASKLTPDSEDQYRFGGGVLIVSYLVS